MLRKNSRSSYTTALSSETSGENLKVCNPVTSSCPPTLKKVIFLSTLCRNKCSLEATWILLSVINALKWMLKPAMRGDRMLTFGRGAWTLRDARTSLCAHAMAAECHQPPDDSSLAWARVADDDGPASLAAACFPQDLFQAREDPITADEGRFCRDAGDFEQQRLQHHICLFEWHQSPWRHRLAEVNVMVEFFHHDTNTPIDSFPTQWGKNGKKKSVLIYCPLSVPHYKVEFIHWWQWWPAHPETIMHIRTIYGLAMLRRAGKH